MLKNVAERLKNNNIEITVSDEVKNYIAEKGFDKTYGARPLRRTIQNLIEDPLAEEMLDGKICEGDKIRVELGEDNKIKFTKD